jgi:hypothetical protein
MARPYRASNKRIIHRTGGGRFRRTTLGDIGLSECENCGKLFAPDFDRAVSPQGFVDPRAMNDLKKLCKDCGGYEKDPQAEVENIQAATECFFKKMLDMGNDA